MCCVSAGRAANGRVRREPAPAQPGTAGLSGGGVLRACLPQEGSPGRCRACWIPRPPAQADRPDNFRSPLSFPEALRPPHLLSTG